jgi:glutamate synthase domain-containing protein 2/glutamate synthase domain-containing protein 1/glutamate synthase domain-containing protein 3
VFSESDSHRKKLEGIKNHAGRGGCGVAALAELTAPASHELLVKALEAISCMEHRGGCLGQTGDGAGLLFRPERETFERFLAPGRLLAPDEPLIVGTVFFLPGERNPRILQRAVDAIIRSEGLKPLGWRRVPIDVTALGRAAQTDVPLIFQLFVAKGQRLESHLEQALYKVRQKIESVYTGQMAVPSLNPYTTVYKALATSAQLSKFFPDLRDPSFKTRVVLGHRRFSTNTFSNWHLVQPFRVLAHNGEINTVKANTRAVKDVERVLGIHNALLSHGSDSSHLDRAVEMMAMTRASGIPEALRRMVPPTWREEKIPVHQQRFYEASRRVLGTLGAWEGPAAIVATDGHTLIGMLDRMGLRPLRWMQLKSGRIIMASEIGAVPVHASEILRDGQLEPGAMIIADLKEGQLVFPRDSTQWIIDQSDSTLRFGDLSTTKLVAIREKRFHDTLEVHALNIFGWNKSRVRRLHDMVKEQKEPVLSMGNDRPLAIFGENYSFYSFLNQIVAVVTNPPIDPLREGQAMDLTVYLGRSPHLGRKGSYRVSAQFKLASPVLKNVELQALLFEKNPDLHTHVLDCTFDEIGDPRILLRRIHELVEESRSAVQTDEVSIIVLSDRRATESQRLPLPPLLVVGSVHRRLAELGLRRDISLVVSTGDVHEAHHLAVLLSYGATAVNPYAMFHLAEKTPGIDPREATDRMVKALAHGLKKIMSKMGITTIEGYRGSALFEAIGLSPEVVDYFLPDTEAQLGGIGIGDIYEEIVARSQLSREKLTQAPRVSVYRKDVTNALQMVARNGNDNGDYEKFKQLLEETPPVYLRDVLRFKKAAQPLEPSAVASVEEIIKTTFRASAMSHGALNSIAHRAIAGAFNGYGALSNCGEGGEDERRNPGGPWEQDRNRVRQVASGRFGVDATYLIGADEIEIKIGQGAKPGEGGHLPGHKVTAEIASIRKTQIGIALISPPPHHDIYSIEDLAQLIRNLREVNPKAVISVKVPSVTNLGTIVVGVTKAGAQVITIAGCTGGTGAASSGSIFHAGLPLERGLSEAHQYLIVNGVRDRVALLGDGGIKCAMDIAKIIALGADMVGFGTALMVAENCVFCHGCHKGNCPVGLTTHDSNRVFTRFMVRHRDDLQDTEMDQRYIEARAGVSRYIQSVAEDLQGMLAQLGLRHPRELVGRVDLLEQFKTENKRWDTLDLSEILSDFRDDKTAATPATITHVEEVSELNSLILKQVAQGLDEGKKTIDIDIVLQPGVSQSAGATLAGNIARGCYAADFKVNINARGYAGQGFGFAATRGMTLFLRGYANDAVGEIMSGDAEIIVVAPSDRVQDSIPHLVGNAACYGATGGTLYVAGSAGQRFGVRNSGATIVAQGVGKYAFEYMTGGFAVVIGEFGTCLGSGLTGGTVVIYDPDGRLEDCLHSDAVLSESAELERLYEVLNDFESKTGSSRAAEILAQWEQRRSQFRWIHSRLQLEQAGAGKLPIAG